jgi:hypothetical protein
MTVPSIKPVFILSVVLCGTLVSAVGYLLWIWHDPDAILYSILGASLGWCAGMLVAPFPHEKTMFVEYSKAVSGFLSGFLVAKVDKVWEVITDEKHRELLFDPVVQRRTAIGLTCFFIIGAAVFKIRSYTHRPQEPEAGAD